jgi:hypothetical protein
LRELEARYPNEIAVIGVHSGKYTAERETPGIRDASIRLDAIHPTINDRQFRLWRAYAVRAWPTLVAIDPRGAVVGVQAGEFTADDIAPFIERAIAASRTAGSLTDGPRHFPADTPSILPGVLAFPGKVAMDGRRIALADSGHHRLLVGTLHDSGLRMRVDFTIGGSEAGYRDGPNPLFRYPQGLALRGDTLYVADAGNHTVREVSLTTGEGRTLAGTGAQLRTERDLAAGAMSSPWDVALANGVLYVAMAGVHQLWTVDIATRRSSVLSGSGAEELHDGTHASAALAQPMGLCVFEDLIYFVDAESSAVRAADRDRSGGVRTIVGTGLFDFGDVDGAGDTVRMQHQQGIARALDGRLLVCDSYNDALKWVDPTSRRADAWVGGLHEPSGLAFDDRAVYVADTNAHRIAVVDLSSAEVHALDIEL